MVDLDEGKRVKVAGVMRRISAELRLLTIGSDAAQARALNLATGLELEALWVESGGGLGEGAL